MKNYTIDYIKGVRTGLAAAQAIIRHKIKDLTGDESAKFELDRVWKQLDKEVRGIDDAMLKDSIDFSFLEEN